MAEYNIDLPLPHESAISLECKQEVVKYLSADELNELQGKAPKNESSTGKEVRIDAMLQEAQTIGVGIGVNSRYDQIESIMNTPEVVSALDEAINFRYIMYQNNIVPAVIGEVNGSIDLDQNRQSAVTTRQSWRILKGAELVTGSPNWRTYLSKSNYRFPKPRKRYGFFMPQSKTEKKSWTEAFCHGYRSGYKQANSLFMTQLATLKRDYLGMLRFVELEQKGIISKPVVQETRLGVLVDDQWVQIDRRDVRITEPATFKASKKWNMTKSIINNHESN